MGNGWRNTPTRTGGEGGIRTLVPLRETRSPGVRARPDYATSPEKCALHTTSGGRLYHESFVFPENLSAEINVFRNIFH